MITIGKLNERNGLRGTMSHQVVVPFPLFFDVRAWCWDAWGPGIEAEHYANQRMVWVRYGGHMPTWAWDCGKFRGKPIDRGRIYLLDDQQLDQLGGSWC
jgi:hypothetical protein